MKENKQKVSETLRKSYSHWTEKQISDLTSHIFFQYGNLNQIDADSVLELLDKTIVEALKSYQINQIEPGLIKMMLPQQLAKVKTEENKWTGKVKQGDLESYSEQASTQSLFDLEKYTEKLVRLEKYVLKFSGLAPKERELFAIWMNVLKRESAHTAFQRFNQSGLSVDFRDELLEEVRHSGWNITDSYFNNLLSKIREKLRGNRDDISSDMLSYIPKEDSELQDLKMFLDKQLALWLSFAGSLNAYRLSVDEMSKMIGLKELFEENGFSFDPNRFPEVYYDDFDKVKAIFPEVKDSIVHFENGVLITPDSFGIYLYSIQAGNLDLPCSNSSEGVIVLFKDRIEAYSKFKGLTSDLVRFVILMHEVGHWLSHWPILNGRRWNYGFQFNNTFTKEGLAQLIAYWASEASAVYLRVLTDLSPKDTSGKVDSTEAYGVYIDLTKHSKVLMLNKLAQLREYWILKDELMIEFLKSEYELLENWAKYKLEQEPDTVFVHDELKNAIYGNNDCAEIFKDGLDLKKLLELYILRIEFTIVKDTK